MSTAESVQSVTKEDLGGGWRETAASLGIRFAAVWALIALVIGFCIALPDTFAQFTTLQTLLATQAVAGVLALAVIFPLAAGEFDLSAGVITGFTALIAAELNGSAGWDAMPTIGLCLLVGPTVGLFNGILNSKLNIDAFVATLATATILQGIAIAISTVNVPTDLASNFSTWSQTKIFGEIPIPALYLLVAAAVVWFLLDVTAWGRYLRIVGANPRSALLIGLPVSWIKLSAFVMAGLFAGLAGIISAMQVGSASQSTGAALLLPAYAAAFVGATTILPGRFNVPGTIVAVFLIAVGVTGLQLLGAPGWVQLVFNGSVLIIAVAVPSRRQRSLAA